MPRFNVLINNGKAEVSGEAYRHLTRALRVKVGDEIEVTDGNYNYTAVIDSIDKSAAYLTVLERRESNEPKVRVTLIQGLPKGDKSELIIQKCVELGVSEIVFFAAERSVVKLDAKQKTAKEERYSKIASSASEQSGRAAVPSVKIADSLSDAIKDIEKVFLIYEKATDGDTLRSVLSDEGITDFAYIIGPEGGIGESELKLCREKEIPQITLGKRILRTETAAIAVAASAMCLLGEME